jgi:hypothetical protein
MATIAVWMLALTLSLCMSILTAAQGWTGLHLGVTAMVMLTIAIVGVQLHRNLMKGGESRSMLAASTARHIGLVWIFGGISLITTYKFILVWREWWVFSLGLLVIGGMCLLLAMMFERDAGAGREDETMLSLARNLNLLQMVGMLLAVIGLVADKKFGLVINAAKSDWAANNIFFFGAIAVACIGAHALVSEKKLAGKPAGLGA